MPAASSHREKLLEIYNTHQEDFEQYCLDCIKVRDHNSAEILSLVFRPGQRVMHDIAEKRKAETGYLRMLLLKNRRFGGSTYISARGYHRATMWFNQNVFIIGHETDSTATLYKMVQLMQEQNPARPSVIKNNENELRFDRPSGKGLKSEYKLATAKNMDAGKSQGIHFLHCSEEAMYPSHAEDLLGGLFQCVPRPPSYTEIWRESTAKGYGNTFQKAVFDAYAEGKYPYFTATVKDYAPHMPDAEYEFTFAYYNPRSQWILIFIPWMLDPSCQREFIYGESESDFALRIERAKTKEDDINYEATRLREKYRLTLKQLYWREECIKTDCFGNVGLFKQENPIDIIEAFRSSGSPLYTADFCDMVEKGCIKPIVVGNIARRRGAPVIEVNPGGHLSVWERYNPREQYFITVDAAGGKREIHQKENREPDKTVIDVWNHRTGDQAAQWYGDIDYDMIADVVVSIGEMYGEATACVELNNHGYKVVGDLKDERYPMYYNKPGEAGWSTNKKTKPEMALDLLDACRNGVITIRCKETVKEMRTFIEKDAKYGAETGTKDDRVTSAQMAVQMMARLPRRSSLQDGVAHSRDRTQDVSETSWMSA